MSKRLRFGPDVSSSVITAPDAPLPGAPKLDVNITIQALHNATFPASVVFAPDAYSVETHTPLLFVHFVAVPVGHPTPATPDEAMVGGVYIIHTADVSKVFDGTAQELALRQLVKGEYNIKSVLEDDPA